MELALDAHRLLIWDLSHTIVSILVFVELALDGPQRRSNQPDHDVSILVFVELALDESVQVVRARPTQTVSILVFVELALDVRAEEGGGAQEVVSILVFVELALDETRWGTWVRT